jgi:predicted DNA-binding ribbon-helix-helix protein
MLALVRSQVLNGFIHSIIPFIPQLTMKLQLHQKTERIIGALRIEGPVFDKIERIAKKQKTSNQTVIRAILNQVIDSVEE